MRQLLTISNSLDAINEYVGRLVSWLSLLMVVGMFSTVVARYIFNSTNIWQNEAILYLHAIAFLCASGYTLKHNAHVRVDVFLERCPPKAKALIDIIGVLLFLLPVCAGLFWFSWHYVASSWSIMEKSREFDGLPWVYILKSFILVFCVTTALQGISLLCRNTATLMQRKSNPTP